MNPLTLVQKIVGGGLLAALLVVSIYAGIQKLNASHWHKKADHAVTALKLEKEGRKADAKRFREAQEAATQLALTQKRATEARYAQIQKEQAHALTLARADADARLKRWMRDHAAGGQQQANLPDHPGSATGPDADDPAAFLVGSADLHRCTEAYVTARGWQDWWAEIQKTQEANR